MAKKKNSTCDINNVAAQEPKGYCIPDWLKEFETPSPKDDSKDKHSEVNPSRNKPQTSSQKSTAKSKADGYKRAPKTADSTSSKKTYRNSKKSSKAEKATLVNGTKNDNSSVDSYKPPTSIDKLWPVATESKSKDFKESQVWINTDLYRKIEKLNICCGKPVPTKHVVNAILQMFIDENKTEIQKLVKSL